MMGVREIASKEIWDPILLAPSARSPCEAPGQIYFSVAFFWTQGHLNDKLEGVLPLYLVLYLFKSLP